MPSFAFISVSLFCHVHPNDVSNFRLLIASCGCRSRSEPGGWLEAVRCWLAAGQFHYRPRMLLTIHEVQSTISNVFSKNHKFWPQLIVSSMHHWKKQSWQLQTILARRRRQCPFSCHLSGRIISLLVSAVASLVTRPQHPMEATQQCLDVFVDGVWGDFFCFSKGVHEKKWSWIMIKIPVSKFNSEVLGMIFDFGMSLVRLVEVSWLAKPPLHRVLSRESRWKQLVIHTPEHVALWTARPARMIKSCREGVCVPCNWMQETASLIHRRFAHDCYKWQPWGFSNDLIFLNPSKWMWCSTSWQSPAGRILQFQNRRKNMPAVIWGPTRRRIHVRRWMMPSVWSLKEPYIANHRLSQHLDLK